uniref:alpha/beta hydrolase n=2 Tax=Turicimonas muris TaxID=1796652 RepID=UPI00339D301B
VRTIEEKMAVKEIEMTVRGKSGNLETRLSIPGCAPKGIAFLSHPHPLFGGNMNNKVIHALNKSFLQENWITVRHNFRGVGKSQGVYDNGAGETEDLLALVQFYLELPEIKALFSSKPKTCFSGFSFGTYVSCNAAFSNAPDFLLLLGTAAEKWKFDLPAVPTFLIHGEKDEVIPLKDALEWAGRFGQAVTVIPNTDHFFSKQIPLLQAMIKRAITWMNHYDPL